MRAPVIILLVLVACAAAYSLVIWRQGSSGFWGALSQQGTSIPRSALERIDSEAFDLFSAVCIEGRRDVSHYEAHAFSLGWQVAENDIHPMVDVKLRAAQMMRDPQLAVPVRGYAHPDHTQVLVLTQLSTSGTVVINCAVYDTAATGLPDLAALSAIVDRPTLSTEEGVEELDWVYPRAWPTLLSVEARFIEEDSPGNRRWGYHGLSFEASSGAQ